MMCYICAVIGAIFGYIICALLTMTAKEDKNDY